MSCVQHINQHISTAKALMNAHDFIQATLPNYNALSDADKLVILLYGEGLGEAMAGGESL